MGCGSSLPAVEEDVISMAWFSKERVVGKGGFGKVNAVRKVVGSDKDTWYAMKTIAKLETVKKGSSALAQVANELRLLRDLSHNRLIQLHYAFHDPTKLYMVTEICLGGDLRYHLHHTKKKANPCVDMSKGKRWFPENTVKYYAAQVLLGLKYLHGKRIIHRDLKPENVVLDQHGQAKIIDFGIAKELPEGQNFCASRSGTGVYQAPEVALKGHKHSFVSDFYSFGVLVYELLVGFNPFLSHADSKALYEVKKNFASKDIVLANGLNSASEHCLDFLKQLLQVEPEKRLGYFGADEVMKHPWFESIDWDILDVDEAPPPFLPECKTSNFHSGQEDLIETFFPEQKEDNTKEVAELADHQHLFDFFSYNKLQVNNESLTIEANGDEGEDENEDPPADKEGEGEIESHTILPGTPTPGSPAAAQAKSCKPYNLLSGWSGCLCILASKCNRPCAIPVESAPFSLAALMSLRKDSTRPPWMKRSISPEEVRPT